MSGEIETIDGEVSAEYDDEGGGELAVREPVATPDEIRSAILSYTDEQKSLIRRTLMPDTATDDELALFLAYSQRVGLDPVARQIHATKRQGKLVIQTAIDGFRLIAARTGRYGGQTAPEWCGANEVWKDVWLNEAHPLAARVGVYRAGFAEPLVRVALWREFGPANLNDKSAFMWKKMPALMLVKCFDEETEVLTDEGFLSFARVGSSRVLQVTESGLEPTDARPFVQEYSGNMVVLDSDDLNFAVTPDHDMVTTAGKVEAGVIFEQARTRPRHWIPRCVPGGRAEFPIPDEAIRLAAIYLADGSAASGRSFRVSVSKPRKVDAIRALGLAVAERVRSAEGERSTSAERTITTRADKAVFTFPFDPIAPLVQPGTKATNAATLLALSRRQARLFADTLIEFDGSTARRTGVRRFYASRPEVMRAFELAAIAGGYSISRRRSRVSDISDRPNYYVTVSDRSEIPVVRWGRAVPYDRETTASHTGLELRPNQSGRVWCVSVPSGMIVVRRHGFSMVCGNCAEAQALRAAFPAELSGVYSDDEMAQADVGSVGAHAIEAQVEHRVEDGGKQPQVPKSFAEWTDRFAKLVGGGESGKAEAIEWRRQALDTEFSVGAIADLPRDQVPAASVLLSSVLLALEARDGDLAFDPQQRDVIARAFAERLEGKVLAGPPWRLSPDENRVTYEAYAGKPQEDAQSVAMKNPAETPSGAADSATEAENASDK